MDGKIHHLMKNKRREIAIILEDLDFIWDTDKLKELAELHEEGKSFGFLSRYFHRDPDEVFLALFHLARNGKIEKIDLRRILNEGI